MEQNQTPANATAGTGDAAIDGKIVKRRSNPRVVNSDHVRSSLEPYQMLKLKRELAMGDKTQYLLAKEYGMTQPGIALFKQRHQAAIDDIRENLANTLAGLPLVRKENRIAMYEDQIEQLRNHPNANHHEWSKGVFIGLHNIAEEVGGLPPRQTITIIPVEHVIVGVDSGDLA